MATWRFRAGVANFAWALKASITFEVTENGGVILQEETMVLHSQWTYFEANSRDGGEESFQDEACDDNDDDGGVAVEENKLINKQKKHVWSRGRTPRSGHLPETKGKKGEKKETLKWKYPLWVPSDPAIDQHSAPVKKCEGSIRTGIRVCRAQSVVQQGGVENVQYATNHKRKGGGSAHAIGSARSASMMAPW